MQKVNITREPLELLTYEAGKPEENPLFFKNRVYQGSCGKVYPLAFIDKVEDTPKAKTYDAVTIENDFVKLVILPEIGGRIYVGADKSNNDYDFFYKNDVIKPALVGLAGPWLSGGVEFNWPQHHRPSTYMPTDVGIEHHEDGSATVWLSEHEPMNRMKGMHGITIKPDSSLIELKARLYNRTAYTQTFLWWANVACEVHDDYQSFFPDDVKEVADHAVRDTVSFPEAQSPYYGIQYQDRPDANDLSFYKNIPVPTSYMITATNYDFFGGYDHKVSGGFVHVACRHIAPGKKQWTWGDDEFGYAWDRELTDNNGPYIELMAGVYTNNQPDFSYLEPYETKTFSQYWWPYQKIGILKNASDEVGIALDIKGTKAEVGVCTPKELSPLKVVVKEGGKTILEQEIQVKPDAPFKTDLDIAATTASSPWLMEVSVFQGDELLLSYSPHNEQAEDSAPKIQKAREPLEPSAIESQEELFLIGEHLEQYRHPTRCPEAYWQEALKRDPLNWRCNTALGRKAFLRGQFSEAHGHFQKAISTLTSYHPNPADGEAHYYGGLCLRAMGRHQEAYPLLYKATWNYKWSAAAYYQLATMDVMAQDYKKALFHLEKSLVNNKDNNKAYVLKSIVLRALGQSERAAACLDHVLTYDRLDYWACFEISKTQGSQPSFIKSAQTLMDIALDYAECGLFQEGLEVLETTHEGFATSPQMLDYLKAYFQLMVSQGEDSKATLARASETTTAYFFPSRLEEYNVLRWALGQNSKDSVAAFGLGNFLYDAGRLEDACNVWQKGSETAKEATIHRNLGMALWNHKTDPKAALEQYEKAMELAPNDGRIIYEYDQLRKKANHAPASRLALLESRLDTIADRDDAMCEVAALYNLTKQPEKALEIVTSRRFHPWEGGEGQVLKEYKTAHLLLGAKAHWQKDQETANAHFQGALTPPKNLGETYHPLQSQADTNYWLGLTAKAQGDKDKAHQYFSLSANESGDFQSMAVAEFSELTYYKAMSMRELGEENQGTSLLKAMATFAKEEMTKKFKIDYFATSLPLIMVFDDDMGNVRRKQLEHIVGLAELGLGQEAAAETRWGQLQQQDPAHGAIIDWQILLKSRR